jgi:mannose-6-phosphate isomerase
LLYDPPIDEFSVFKVNVKAGASEKHRAVEGPSICVVTEGRGNVSWGEGEGTEEVERGEVVFVGAGVEVKWASEEGLEVFRAYVEA